MIRVVSFDLYNCLVDLRLDEKIWVKLKSDWTSVFDEVKDNAITYVFDDVRRVLPALKRKYALAVFTAENKEYATHKLQIVHLSSHVSRVISTQEFGDKSKTAESFVWLMKQLNVEPSEMIHVGDDRRFDYALPRQVGIRSFLLDRTGFEQGPDVVRSLVDVETELALQRPTNG
ncbi:HAD family hydrolase [Candidatus Woesearchaeota archaeon]|nr:HAD family hydrolase [Candidatus Woesearchaeota archaeon]